MFSGRHLHMVITKQNVRPCLAMCRLLSRPSRLALDWCSRPVRKRLRACRRLITRCKLGETCKQHSFRVGQAWYAEFRRILAQRVNAKKF